MAKPFWLFFFKDPITGSISGAVHGHNAIADYRGDPYFIGMKKIEINLEEMEQ